ncbi:hypothetical protein [Bradyrhizobium liaoningense]|uniref:hypothetical protein n=1 Tax=Bradyrhizobium liaoningense TaxID=43992 RepID=UPI001BA880C6|nr:hypothetical protein [Bradyrhizobium liaoningense]MBR0859319.1 hypothetical protein [Bradyrhizobium liaoningense]
MVSSSSEVRRLRHPAAAQIATRECDAALDGLATRRSVLKRAFCFQRQNGHWTAYCWLDPVAIDPHRTCRGSGKIEAQIDANERRCDIFPLAEGRNSLDWF